MTQYTNTISTFELLERFPTEESWFFMASILVNLSNNAFFVVVSWLGFAYFLKTHSEHL
jgi:hypothetical protein